MMSDLMSKGELFNKLATVQTLGEAYGVIQEMPTVDAVPVRHGRWNCSDDVYESAVCSVCGWDTTEPWVHIKEWFKFCPHCGADMRKDGEHDRG